MATALVFLAVAEVAAPPDADVPWFLGHYSEFKIVTNPFVMTLRRQA